jgi:hypothetical protein
VQALIDGRRLTLMDLARSWPDAERVAAPLKKLDRLLGNRHLAEEREGLYGAMLAWSVCQDRPVIVVDWSELDARGRFHVLRAALAVGGRTLTLWERVCPAKQTASPKIERALLHALARSMPAGVRPILVADAGFRAPWFEAVSAMGWDWVGRLRHRMLVKPCAVADTPDQWVPCRMLYALVNEGPRDLGTYNVVRSRPVVCRLVVHRKPRRGRIDRTRSGARARGSASRKVAQRESEPWLLAASPSLDLTSAQIVAIYARRMQIELSFRDLKSHRYGVGFEDSLTRSADRLSVLLLIHALVCFVAWIAAKTAAPSLVRAAIAMTTRLTKAISISWHRIGWQLLRAGRWRPDLAAAARITGAAGDALAAT